MYRLIPIISVGLLIILILGGGYLGWTRYGQFKIKSAELEIAEKKFGEKQEYISKLRSLETELEKYSQETDKIESGLPQDPSVPALFNYVSQKSSENGLILRELNLGKIGQSAIGNIKEISFPLAFSGSYPAFKNFLASVQKSVRMISIRAISFTSPEDEELFDFNLDANSYFYEKSKNQPQEPGSAPGESGLGPLQ